ncbi:hypothetical protein [Chryseobacterium populi]|uniref:Microcystin-dependent protein n=1 Tax=Chryseobacterium populi TaxID=1144316 RepID=J2K6G1_9FLAO|nr:hypothetical protein [Chryseobacterium populi]EJL68818.1 hypothetical protein PMI13_03463 [Chryseobacterium populi]
MKRTITIFIFSLGLPVPSLAQKSLVGIGTANPQVVLDVVSTNHGILIPRQTAFQIENMQSPDESELAYSLTDNGIIITRKGFWYFHAGTWFPLTGNSSNNENIYTVNGTLISNRQVSQDGKQLNIGPGLLYLDGATSATGILTSSPTQTIDVDGNVRIQTFNKVAGVMSNAQGVLMNNSDFFEIGDVKPSFVTSDHDGWYLLDGRNITTLPQAAQNNASSILGITTLLPNAAGSYSMGTTAATGSISGSSTATLTRANLPNVNLNYTTDAEAGHSHTMTYQRIRTTTAFGGGNNIHVYWLAGTIVGGGGLYNISSTTIGHSHTYTVNSGGTAAPINIQPAALNANYFVYLGQ